MKSKNLLAAFGLAAVASFAVALGVSVNKNAEPVHADADTWMINASVDMGSYLTGLDGFNANSVVFRCGLDGSGGWAEASMYPSGVSNIYNVNLSFADGFTFNRIQVKFSQGGAEKYSVTCVQSGSKASHSQSYYLTAEGTDTEAWDGGNWKASSGAVALTFKYGESTLEATEDIPNKRFICSNVSLEANASKYLTFRYRSSWEHLYDTLTDSAKDYINPSYGAGWVSIKTAGNYDIILKNNGGDNGILDLKLRQSSESYIYYVTQSSSETVDYIYTYGNDESFGAWPGTKVTEVEGVVELFGDSEDFKFNHSGYEGSKNRRVYKIPLTIGYPKDDQVIFNYYVGDKDPANSQSENMTIEGGCAYFWTSTTNWRNPNDGVALEYIVKVEAARKAAADGSICGISTAKAKELYDEYAALLAPQKNIINQCQLYTWTDNTKTAKADITYDQVMHRIGVIGGVVADSAFVSIGFMKQSNTATFVIVAVIAGTFTIGLGLFFVSRKARRQ